LNEIAVFDVLVTVSILQPHSREGVRNPGFEILIGITSRKRGASQLKLTWSFNIGIKRIEYCVQSGEFTYAPEQDCSSDYTGVS